MGSSAQQEALVAQRPADAVRVVAQLPARAGLGRCVAMARLPARGIRAVIPGSSATVVAQRPSRLRRARLPPYLIWSSCFSGASWPRPRRGTRRQVITHRESAHTTSSPVPRAGAATTTHDARWRTCRVRYNEMRAACRPGFVRRPGAELTVAIDGGIPANPATALWTVRSTSRTPASAIERRVSVKLSRRASSTSRNVPEHRGARHTRSHLPSELKTGPEAPRSPHHLPLLVRAAERPDAGRAILPCRDQRLRCAPEQHQP